MREPDPAASPKEIVRIGWDRVSDLYRPDGAAKDAFARTVEDAREWLRPLFDHLAPGARVLDLGCGCGIPTAALLAERFSVRGIDISDRQIERARRRVPRAEFVRADMASLDVPPATVDAVVCLYAIIHLPLGEQRPLLARIRRWLTPGGWLVLVAGRERYEGIERDWLGSGATMYWSHADAATYRAWLAELGFTLVDERFLPEGSSGHELFRARLPPP